MLKINKITHRLGGEMKKSEAITLLNNEKTIYSRQELLKIGMSDTLIGQLVHDDIINRINQGLYTTEETEIDTEHILQLKYSQCIISHESALYHLGYSDRVPENISITIPQNFGTSRLKNNMVKIRYCNPKFIFYGTTKMTSVYGNTITIYNLERTICDIIRHYQSIDIEIANKAIRKYCNENKKKLSILMLYAKKMGIIDKVQNRLEVLI